jgi:phosphonate transport system ATP-binding protein
MIEYCPPRRSESLASLYDAPSSLMVPAITLDGVTVHRGEAEVLRDVSLTLFAGIVTAVVGRSGVGKTTLIRLLNGLQTPSRGQISVAGIGPLDVPGALRAHRRRTATVFQDHALIDRLPTLDNVLLGLADLRHPLSPLPWSRAFRERAAQALDDVGLLHRATTPTGQLSGGERQRVGVARALVRRPALLLGDEPFASVDPSLVIHLSQEFRRTVSRSGVTVVVVLHQIETALSIADRIVALADGGVVFDGPPGDFDTVVQARVFRGLRPIPTPPLAARAVSPIKEKYYVGAV